MASAIFALDLKGKVLISRNYRGDIPMSAVEKFMPLVLEAEEEQQAPTPCFTHEGVNYLYIRHNNLYCILPYIFRFFVLINLINLYLYFT